MKRFIFTFSFLVLFFTPIIFCISDKTYMVTIFNKEDVIKYLLIKQAITECPDKVVNHINSLLVGLKPYSYMFHSAIINSGLSKFKFDYAFAPKNSSVSLHRFIFTYEKNMLYNIFRCNQTSSGFDMSGICLDYHNHNPTPIYPVQFDFECNSEQFKKINSFSSGWASIEDID